MTKANLTRLKKHEVIDFGLGCELIMCIFSCIIQGQGIQISTSVVGVVTWGWVGYFLAFEREGLWAGLGEGSGVSRSSVICSACSFSSSMYRTHSKISPSSSLRDTQIWTLYTQVDDWLTFFLICFNYSHRSGSKWLFSSSFWSSLCSSFANKKLLSKERRPSKSCDSS